MNNPFKGKHGSLLIAEIGGNHEGNFDYTKKLAQQAIDTNVDYVKFQIYTGDTLVSSVESPDRNKHFRKFELIRRAAYLPGPDGEGGWYFVYVFRMGYRCDGVA